MTHTSLFLLGIAGLVLCGLFFWLDNYNIKQAQIHHERARAIGRLQRAYARAEMMVQRRDLSVPRQLTVRRFIEIVEREHNRLGLERTDRFNRLRQTLVRNHRGFKVVV